MVQFEVISSRTASLAAAGDKWPFYGHSQIAPLSYFASHLPTLSSAAFLSHQSRNFGIRCEHGFLYHLLKILAPNRWSVAPYRSSLMRKCNTEHPSSLACHWRRKPFPKTRSAQKPETADLHWDRTGLVTPEGIQISSWRSHEVFSGGPPSTDVCMASFPVKTQSGLSSVT